MTETGWRGIAAPLAGGGRFAAYGPPPWSFEGFSASVFLAFEPKAVADLIPPPLRLAGDPVCRLSAHDMICDYGWGERYTQENPDQSNFHEAVLGLMVEADGVLGQWCPYLWCDTEAEFAVGRELYGWQQRLGQMALTRRPLRRGWREGDRVAALLTRGRRSVFSFAITLERVGDLPPIVDGLRLYPDQARANNHFMETVLPHPTERTVVRRLAVSAMVDTEVNGLWSGRASVEVAAPELAFLRNARVLGGRWHELSWKKPWPGRLIREHVDPA
jgi:acetoacetate decarboxylase